MAEERDARWLPPEAPGGEAPVRWDGGMQTAAVPPPPPTAPPGLPRVPYPTAPPPAYPAPNGQATAGLILGIAGLSVLVLGAGFFFFISLPCSILAWVFGAKAKRRIERGEALEGRSQAESAYVLGIIGVILGALGMLVWIVLIVLGAAVSSGDSQGALTAAAGAFRALAALLG
jgi:hypothetical protein